MLYDYFGLSVSMDSILSNVFDYYITSPLEKTCILSRLAPDAHSRGLFAATIAVSDPLRVISSCLGSSFEVILNLWMEEATVSHSVLVTNVDSKGIFVNDPFFSKGKGVNRRIYTETLLARLRGFRGSSIPVSNIMTILSSSPDPDIAQITFPDFVQSVPLPAVPFLTYLLRSSPEYWIPLQGHLQMHD